MSELNEHFGDEFDAVDHLAFVAFVFLLRQGFGSPVKVITKFVQSRGYLGHLVHSETI